MITSRNIFYFIAIGLGVFFMTSLFSCSDEVNKKMAPKPYAMGRLNEIVVVSDKEVWESMVGDTFEYYFSSAYPILPRPEPIFDIRHFTHEQIQAEPLRRELRTYVVLADLNDTQSGTTQMVRSDLGEDRFQKAKSDTAYNSTVGLDKWAQNQIVVYLFANGYDELASTIRQKFDLVTNRINKHDDVQLEANIYTARNADFGLESLIQNEFDISLRVPGDYNYKYDEENNFMMIKKDTKEAAQSIVIRKFPYTSKDMFSKESIIEMRNEYGQKFITSDAQTSYMQTNVRDLPVFDYTYNIDGAFTKELRGIWEMTDDFIGGPFATYVIHNEGQDEVVFIDAFVYAPGKKQRDFMQQLDFIVRNATVIKTEKVE